MELRTSGQRTLTATPGGRLAPRDFMPAAFGKRCGKREDRSSSAGLGEVRMKPTRSMMAESIKDALRRAIAPITLDQDDQVALVDRETVREAADRIDELEAE